MARLFLTAVMSVLALGVGRATAQVRHHLEVVVEPAGHRLVATDRIILPVEGAPELDLSLSPSLAVDRVEGADSWRRDDDGTLRLQSVGRQLVVAYHGELHDPPQPSGHLHFLAGDSTGGTIGPEGVYLDEGSGWYPDPDLGLAHFDLDVRVPPPFVAVSQGRLVERGEGRSRWRSTLPADGLALVAGPYRITQRRVDDIEVATYLLRDDPDTAGLFLDATATYLRRFQELLGPYFYPRFDIVENFFSSGYGLPAFTLLGPGVISQGARALRPGYVDHEIVHNWWGNGVFVDPDDGNWCEGLTSYCANYLARERESRESAARHRAAWSQRYAIEVDPSREYPLRNFRWKQARIDDAIGYSKSAALFHQVRRRMGDEPFFTALQRFAGEYRGRRANWSDLQRTFEVVAGQPFDHLFRVWLEEKGGAVVRLREPQVAAEGQGWRLRAKLSQGEVTYPLDVDLRVETTGGLVEVRRRITTAEVSIDLHLQHRPRSLRIDPDHHLFRRVSRAEIVPSLNALLAGESIRYVVAAGDSPVYRRLAEAAREEHGGEVIDLDGLPAPGVAGNLWFLGSAGLAPTAAAFLEGHPEVLDITPTALHLAGGPDHVDRAILATWPRPGHPGAFVGVYWGAGETALARARYLFYYGRDSAVLFRGGRPVERLQWPPAEDPMSLVFEEGGTR